MQPTITIYKTSTGQKLELLESVETISIVNGVDTKIITTTFRKVPVGAYQKKPQQEKRGPKKGSKKPTTKIPTNERDFDNILHETMDQLYDAEQVNIAYNLY